MVLYASLPHQVEEWLKEVDVDCDGVLSYEEFKMSIAGNLLIDL